MFNILIDIKSYFSVQPLLIKGINTYPLNVCELFGAVKTENGILE